MDRIGKFKVVNRIAAVENNTIYLIKDNWDDWFTFETKFNVTYVNRNGDRISLGSVKIGQKNQEGRRPNLGDEFFELADDCFSLGTSDYYYEQIKKLKIREEYLTKLRDVAFNLEIFENALKHDVMNTSLLRDITVTTVKGQFNRMANGGARLTDYCFDYLLPTGQSVETKGTLSFEVESDKKPPTNIHVLIGKNGVGKTTILKRMLYAVEGHNNISQVGKFDGNTFSNVVFVSFSAFDMSISAENLKKEEIPIPYTFVGLVEKDHVKSGAMLAEDFSTSLYMLVKGSKRKLWEKAIDILESDNTFTELNIKNWSKINFSESSKRQTEESNPRGSGELDRDYNLRIEKKFFMDEIIPKFKKLSSGHKVILLTIAKLVELVEEKTLVLLDEPEEHLHPPLVSAFIRALSDLLIYRNGVGIIATHSPVIVQEVPKKCVWILRRAGDELIAERPRLETFGENLGELTSEIFGYEVTNSGFHKMLQDAVKIKSTYRSASSYFHDELGKEARSILKSYMYEKEGENR